MARLGSVNYEVRGRIAILTLDEPAKLNALTTGIREGILDGLKRADDDDAVRVAIITGSGDKAFCAGADIGTFDFEPEKARHFLAAALDVLAAPERCGKSVISAVNGIAYGGGRLYVTAGYPEIQALDPSNGGLIWRRQLTAPPRSAVTYSGDRLYVTTLDNQTQVMSAADGHAGRDACSFGGEVDRHGLHAGNRLQGLFDAADGTRDLTHRHAPFTSRQRQGAQGRRTRKHHQVGKAEFIHRSMVARRPLRGPQTGLAVQAVPAHCCAA